MNLFYAYRIEGESIAHLDEIESRHCTKTLRKGIGDTIYFTSFSGATYLGKIIDVSKKRCRLKILDVVSIHAQTRYNIHIAIAPTKNINRLEWFLEKTTELGIDAISLIQCQHSERKKIRIERLNKIILAAAKQSLKNFLPELSELTPFKEFIKNVKDQNKYIAHCNSENLPHLQEVIGKKDNNLILIGPEGDFSSNEIEYAKQNDFKEVSLGPSRLRTETAGIIACHTLHLTNTKT
ncbi:MAG: 16S rRNA (uracil(1498)-N(3))-methyltransferase [Saprospiraceae bacterium]|nr:16S rRNA (uracil(1498)-N(3))-methyltransferase [Saprospiraceae bacterium]